MKKVLIINGPNLNMLGKREPEHYGKLTLEAIEILCKEEAKKLGLDIDFRQSNFEGEIIELIQNASSNGFNAIIINAGGYSHTSIAIMDSLIDCKIDVIEVHLSNIFAREDYRNSSYISKTALGVISGFKEYSYILAMNAIANK